MAPRTARITPLRGAAPARSPAGPSSPCSWTKSRPTRARISVDARRPSRSRTRRLWRHASRQRGRDTGCALGRNRALGRGQKSSPMSMAPARRRAASSTRVTPQILTWSRPLAAKRAIRGTQPGSGARISVSPTSTASAPARAGTGRRGSRSPIPTGTATRRARPAAMRRKRGRREIRRLRWLTPTISGPRRPRCATSPVSWTSTSAWSSYVGRARHNSALRRVDAATINSTRRRRPPRPRRSGRSRRRNPCAAPAPAPRRARHLQVLDGAAEMIRLGQHRERPRAGALVGLHDVGDLGALADRARPTASGACARRSATRRDA